MKNSKRHFVSAGANDREYIFLEQKRPPYTERETETNERFLLRQMDDTSDR